MALCRSGPNPLLESNSLAYLAQNLSTRLIVPVPLRFAGQFFNLGRRKYKGVCCSSLRKAASASSVESQEDAPSTFSVCLEEELDHVIQFKMSDFKILDHVSIGLGGRADEVVFEGKVKDSGSPLYNSRVVLRQLSSAQAQRRGKRAIEVLKKLVRRKLLYHSYSMQVHGYISLPATGGSGSFILVHGYHGSFSLRHWLQQSDWLPTLEATLALDEESVRRVGEDTTGGPAVSRQLRLTRILMRDLLIGVNYLHSHGLAHTELRLENVHISPIDRHIKVGILGNAADFYEDGSNSDSMDSMDRRQMMIAFDMRCVGFIMVKMVMRELIDPLIFSKFKTFLTKGYDPSCLRELMLEILGRSSPYGNAGFQILDRNWGAGWHLLSLLLATKSSKRISCLDALRHPFLCGPRWRVVPSMDIIRWGLGSTAMRISEEYIYRQPQRSRLAHFIDLMEMLNPHPKPKNWLELLPGKWRLLYCTGKHVGLTLRQPPARVLIGDVHLTVRRASKLKANLSFVSDIGFSVLIGQDWPHDKAGKSGRLQVNSSFVLTAGRRLYLKQDKTTEKFYFGPSSNEEALAQKFTDKKWRKIVPFKELPSCLPAAKLASSDIDVTMSLDDPLNENIDTARNVLQELRTQVPPEIFDLSKLVCGTYVDSRMLVLRGVNGSALLFTRSFVDRNSFR
ncbi:probable plastid-lipid-associated protein 14, chloroplastic [Gastrolobium bilobum]|uniref:probable plastid-lipid-associated protein 14, chloroplastic n=1 Tax=Gastrolobium bilobum TaxID=150636 RepID=UPI002AB05EF4|nr:probable plastid-lipid-associated protein 14, chloroplastic [Gastrolobium bilobum]XP_061345696.1 probable plastid-lipid-associated protein 14, chloroplastic [Gastrolobium bilobum]